MITTIFSSRPLSQDQMKLWCTFFLYPAESGPSNNIIVLEISHGPPLQGHFMPNLYTSELWTPILYCMQNSARCTQSTEAKLLGARKQFCEVFQSFFYSESTGSVCSLLPSWALAKVRVLFLIPWRMSILCDDWGDFSSFSSTSLTPHFLNHSSYCNTSSSSSSSCLPSSGRKGLRLACNAYCVGNRPSHFPLR